MWRPEPDWPAATLLGRLHPDVRNELLALGYERTFAAKSTLIRYGEPGEHAIVLLESVAKVLVHSPDGVDALLAVRVAGDLVGEMALLDGSCRSANVVACGDMGTRIINRADFDAFLHRAPGAACEVSRMISERLRWSDRRRVDFVARSALTRLVHVLVEIAETYGSEIDGQWELGVPLTQAELGSLAGMARRTVEKQLSELQSAGLIESSYRRIALVDMAELRRVADLAAPS